MNILSVLLGTFA